MSVGSSTQMFESMNQQSHLQPTTTPQQQQLQQQLQQPQPTATTTAWLKYDDGLLSIPYPNMWQNSRQNSILYFFSNIQLSSKNLIKDNVNVQIVISGDQTIDDLIQEGRVLFH
jgi:hypothetical protein